MRQVGSSHVFRAFMASCLVLSAGLSVGLAKAQNDDAQPSAASRYLTQIEDLESDYGPLDSRLLEPLASLAATELARQNPAAASALLRRQLQIARNTYGFVDPRLVPILDALIQTEVLSADWRQVADYLSLRSQLFVAAAEKADEAADGAGETALVAALSEHADWLVQQVALMPTRDAVRTFFDARDVEERLSDRAQERLDDIEEGALDDDTFARFRLWAPVAYRQAYIDYSLVQLLNAGSGFSYDTIDYLTRREGGSAMVKLSSPGYGARFSSGSFSRIPMLEKGDPIGIGFLRDGYFTVKNLDELLSDSLKALDPSSADPATLSTMREALAMIRLARGDFQVLQMRGSGVREYNQARELLLDAGIDQERVDDYFSRTRLIPAQALTLSFPEADSGDTCLPAFTALSEDLATLPQPRPQSQSLQLTLPYAEYVMRFDVTRRGRASGVEVISASSDDSRMRRAANRALRDRQFRPAVAQGRTARLRDQCITLRLPMIDAG